MATYRRVQVNEDGTRDVFAAAGLSEEGLVGSALAEFLRIGVGATIRQKAVLEEVAGGLGSVVAYRHRGACGFEVTYSSQALLPSWVPAWPM